MTQPVLAGVPAAAEPPRRPTAPSSGVLAVTRLLAAPAPEQVPVADAHEVLEPGSDPRHRRPQLRLVTRDGAAPDVFATRFAQTLVEVVAGERGAHQLLHWTTPAVYDRVVRRSATLQRAASNAAPSRRLRAQVRSVHVGVPVPGAAELSIHARHGARSRAIAARLELGEDGRWRCCALQLG